SRPLGRVPSPRRSRRLLQRAAHRLPTRLRPRANVLRFALLRRDPALVALARPGLGRTRERPPRRYHRRLNFCWVPELRCWAPLRSSGLCCPGPRSPRVPLPRSVLSWLTRPPAVHVPAEVVLPLHIDVDVAPTPVAAAPEGGTDRHAHAERDHVRPE